MNMNITFLFRPGGNLFLNRGLSAASAGGVGAGGMLFNLLFPLGYNLFSLQTKSLFFVFLQQKDTSKSIIFPLSEK